ncbi:MAG TPA: hypothetical protein VH702_14965 [Vicinamibacterales bacterium]
MTRTIRSISLSLILVFIGTAPSTQPSANAQSPPKIDLNGVWDIEGTEGDRVLIRHTARELKASFISGGKCSDGYARTDFLDGRPSVAITPGATNDTFTGTMIVCSGSPDLVKKCGLPSWYETDFTMDVIQPDKISGERYGQRLNDCQPAGRADLRRFTLTRNRCAELEREVNQLEQLLNRSMEVITTERRDVMVDAHSAAQRRYGDTYTFNSVPSYSRPTNTLVPPYFQLANNVPGSAVPIYANVEDYFLNLPTVMASDQWRDAKRMVEAMAREPNPVREVVDMRDHMIAAETDAQKSQPTAVKLRDARRARVALVCAGLP